MPTTMVEDEVLVVHGQALMGFDSGCRLYLAHLFYEAIVLHDLLKDQYLRGLPTLCFEGRPEYHKETTNSRDYDHAEYSRRCLFRWFLPMPCVFASFQLG